MHKLNIYLQHLIFLVIITITVSGKINAQNDLKKLVLDGHLQNLNTAWIQDVNTQWYTMGSIYNRLNLKYYMHQNWTFTASARNVVTYGQLVYLSYPTYTDLLIEEGGYMNLTGAIASDSSYVFYTNIDRLHLQFNKGNMDVRIGRQRINWGINMVWNPNDIFNTFNYYDFDYIERPGCDAIRVQYYTGVTSSVEAAIKINAEDKITAAAMYRFNRWNYDFQLMGGVMEDDVVIGGGWSGNIQNAGFTGEGSYFIDKNNIADTSGVFVLSFGANYTFKNSLFLHGSVLYNSTGTTGKAGWGNSLIVLQDLSPKTFTLAKYSIFSQISFPASPLINTDISYIYNPYDHSMFVGPNVSFSLSENITLLIMAQIFIGESGTEFGDNGKLFYSRLKWSF
ncbi:MAG: hypothetical protein K8R68_10515 [Bacteroidales bacterium]|nr:hypothetical protein [Bacteroidales bacterium]